MGTLPEDDPLAEVGLRELVPAVIGILVGRGADFATAEDAVQDALIEALRTWPDDPPRDRRGWLVTVAWRKFLDMIRAEGARNRREERVAAATLAESGNSAGRGLIASGTSMTPSTSTSSAPTRSCAPPRRWP